MVENNAEPIKLNETFSTSNQRVALQTRLILGGEALSADKKDFDKINPEQLVEIKPETYTKIAGASIGERSSYWQEKSAADQSLSSFDQQLKSWSDSLVAFMNDPSFTEKEALNMYQKYFGENKGQSNINLFVDDILSSHTQNGVVNSEQLNTDLPHIKKLANIFGGNSAEIVESLILSKTKLADPAKKQELIDQVNEEKSIDGSPTLRIDWLNPEEDRLLRWLSEQEKTTVIEPILTKPSTELTKLKTEPIRVTPEQNLQAAQIFCNNLRQQLKNGSMEKSGSNYRFTDPRSKISIEASTKDAVDTAWFSSAELELYAEKNQLPFIMLVKGGNHFNLLIKGPEQQPDGKYEIQTYDPFHNSLEYVEVPVTEDFNTFSSRELSKMEKLYNPSTQRYEFANGAWIEKDRINQYLFTKWFKPPPNMDISYNNRVGWAQLFSGEYNLSLLEDSEIPEELKFGKTQRFQFDGSNCGPLCLYTSMLLYAAKPGREQEKQRLSEQFANDFGIRILTRKELLGK